jgi:hypothetical protein
MARKRVKFRGKTGRIYKGNGLVNQDLPSLHGWILQKKQRPVLADGGIMYVICALFDRFDCITLF